MCQHADVVRGGPVDRCGSREAGSVGWCKPSYHWFNSIVQEVSAIIFCVRQSMLAASTVEINVIDRLSGWLLIVELMGGGW